MQYQEMRNETHAQFITYCNGTIFLQGLTCLGIASHATPNMAHLWGVRKYTGPGCSGLLG